MLAVFFMLMATTAFNQIPQGFNYQTVVRNSSGIIVTDQPVYLKISFTSSDGLSVYYSEEHVKTSSSAGVVNLEVGTSDNHTGLLQDIPWSSGGIMLKVEVKLNESDSYTNMGSSLLRPVPYALFALGGLQGPAGKDGKSFVNKARF